MSIKRILIIDDEENFCRLIKRNLEQRDGFQVAIAANGNEGIKIAKELKPDLILLDIVMPGIDGGEVSAMIANDESLKNIPIVFLSAVVTEADVDSSQGVISGYSVLSKTITADELAAFIEEKLSNK